MGADTLIRAVLFRFALPLTLLAASIVRYNGLSMVYLMCLLVIPLLPSPTRRSVHSVKLQLAVLGFSSIFIVAHSAFQIGIFADKPYGHIVKPCTTAEKLARQIGFNRFDNTQIIDIFRLLAPDVIVFIVSLICVLTCRKIRRHHHMPSPHQTIYTAERSPVEDVLPFFVALMLLIGGITQPNVLAATYFLVFLFLGTCWACHRSIRLQKQEAFFCMKILLTLYAALHVLLLYLYQFEFFQSILDPSDINARLFGFPAIVLTNCYRGRDLEINHTLNWPDYMYPFVIFLVYWILATEIRYVYQRTYKELWAVRTPWWNRLARKKDARETERLIPDENRLHQYSTFSSTEVQPEQPALPNMDQEELPANVQGTFSSILMFLMRQSYITALIVMMAWSITYHSWLTFVLLLWACLTWITPFARWFCMVSSPYLVIYTECLLVLQYIYGLNLNDKELPTKKDNVDYAELGLKKWSFPCLHLGAQTLFMWVFWMTLRQHVRERKMRRRQATATSDELVLSSLARPIVEALRRRAKLSTAYRSKYRGESDVEEVDSGPPSDDAKEFIKWIKSTLAKYWILVCCAAFLLVALQKDVSLLQILYMVIFLFGFVIYQFSVGLWKTILRPLWWFMVVYSILILLVVYTYQFENMHTYWSNGTHLSDNWLHDLGLRQHNKATLLVELLIPTIFSIVLVIQLHFFHKPLMMKINRLLLHRKQRKQRDSLTTATTNQDEIEGQVHEISPNTVTSQSETDNEEPQNEKSALTKILYFYRGSAEILWRFGEIHYMKIISFVVMMVVVQQVSAINALFIIFVAISMPSRKTQKLMNYFFVVWATVVIMVLMFYQLRFVKEDILRVNCTAHNRSVTTPTELNHFSSNAWWVGFRKSLKVSKEVRGYLFIVLAIVCAKVIKHHQETFRFQKSRKEPPAGVLFEGITRENADENVANCIKYLCNHFFDAFGFELNLIVMMIAMAVRCDAVAVLYSLWVVTFLFIKRKNSEIVWPFYIGFIAIAIPLQYLLILGWPPGLCLDYPWSNSATLNPNLAHWLYLTDVLQPQNQHFLIADYFLLLVACCQETVFAKERQKRTSSELGSSVTGTRYNAGHYIPPDFMVNRTWLDFIKVVLLEQFYWLTLSIVYITAQSTASIFNFGFIVSCFFFLWHGQSLYLRPKHTMRRWWKTFIAYNFFVMLAKVWLQLVACVWIDDVKNSFTHACALIEVLNLYCFREHGYRAPHFNVIKSNCISVADNGLAMDCVCFVFALIQYRIFKSIYFKYVIREHTKQSDMANRGAQLVEERLKSRLQESIKLDRNKMNEIRKKVEKIKIKQQRQNPDLEEPLSHYEAVYSAVDYWYETDESEESEGELISRTIEDDVTTGDVRETAISVETRTEGATPKTEPKVEGHVDGQLDEHRVPTDEAVVPAPIIAAASITDPTDGIRHRKKTDVESPAHSDIHTESPVDQSSMVHRDTTSEEEETKSCSDKAKEFGNECRQCFENTADSLIAFSNDISADYRAIAAQLDRERKEKYREQARQTHQRHQQQQQNSQRGSPKPDTTLGRLNKTLNSSSGSNEDDSDTWSMITADEDQIDGWQKQDSRGVRLAVAIYYALLANTDLLCYAFMIINHMYYACLLSLPLPFFVFLWGMLSIPRPTKRFWIAIISYSELVIVIKYVFQFEFVGLNECNDQKVDATIPLCIPRILGIERKAYSSVCDLLLLLALFFHRFALKAHGLWREQTWAEDEDNLQHGHSHTLDETQTLEDSSPLIDYNGAGFRPLYPSQTDNILSPTGTRSSSTHSSERDNKGVCHNIKRFIERMLDPEVGTGAVDVYALMFGCQFIVFLIIAFSWNSFSSPESNKNNFAQIIQQNVVPRTFLYMLLTQFLLMVLDRFLYLRKLVFAKMLYLVVLVFSFHIFMFLVVPYLTNKRFVDNYPAIFMYLFQCCYFGLSAYQVRCGYPTRILGNFLTKHYTVTSVILFQGIQAIPFLLELRSVLDWVCTNTTLGLSHWLKMEDIYANVYILKSWRDSEKMWPHPRGMLYWISSKWSLGGLLVVLLIVIIWFPLLFMSFVNAAYIANTPMDATFTLSIGAYQPLFKVSAQQQFLQVLTDKQVHRIDDATGFQHYPNWDTLRIESFLKDYLKKGTVVAIRVLSNSSAIWTISPPSRAFLIKDLESNASLSLRFHFEFTRTTNSAQAALVQETVTGYNSILLKPDHKVRRDLARILKSPYDGEQIRIRELFPTFIQVPANGAASPVYNLGGGCFVRCIIKLRKGSIPQLSNNSLVEWWEVIQEEPVPMFASNGSLEIITLNDLVPPLHLSFFTSKGIIGLYIGFVWLIGKFVRIFFTSISYRIMFDEMPNVDKVLKLCLEIYMVRESFEMKLEEDLYAKLIYLYRSPETLIRWTKYKRL